MNPTYIVALIALLIAVVLCAVLGIGSTKNETVPHHRQKGFRRTWRKLYSPPSVGALLMSLFTGHPPRRQVTFANIGEGTHGHGRKSYIADAATTARFLLYKKGTDVDHCALCSAADIPLGPSEDQADAGGLIQINLLGACEGTQRFTTDGSIADGDFIVSADNGKVRKLPAVTGTYYIIGKAIIPTDASSADGDPIAATTSLPTQRVVA